MSLPTFTPGTKIKAQDMNDALAQIFNMMYPVGSIYMSATMATAADVSAALGGTWEAWGSGRVPVGVDADQAEFDTVEETGGEKKHTLIESELPLIDGSWTLHGEESGTIVYHIHGHATGTLMNNTYETTSDEIRSGANSYRQPGFSFGSNGAHNNLQPYITCYMYKRTA